MKIKINTIFNICLICILLGLATISIAQNKSDNFTVDHAQFKLQENYVFLEIYYSIVRDKLNFIKSEKGFEAKGLIKTYITQNNKTMLIDSLLIEDFVETTNEISPVQKFAEVSMIQIEEGDYLLNATFTDLNSKEKISVKDSLKLRAFSKENLCISDIELANQITAQKDRVFKFDKNGLRVIPNATQTYGTGLNKIYFYAEVYNLQTDDSAKGSNYHLDYFIVDQNNSVITEMIGRPKAKPGNSSIINGGLDISHLLSGYYSFKIKVTDDFTGKFVEVEKKFYIYKIEDFLASSNKDIKKKEIQIFDEYANMSEDSLDLQFQIVKYIAFKDEKKVYKKLDINGKRNFMNNFWKVRDPNPNTVINERKINYHNLIEFANLNFSVGKKRGFKTDRARVLLKYGQPDEVERNPSSFNTKAYQKWLYYNVEGGVEFVFVDTRGVRDFQLVHSTARNEVYEPGWKTRYAGL